MTQILNAIIRVGIFMICAQVLIHFRPNGSYAKYLKILVSIMLLTQIFSPILSVLAGGTEAFFGRIEYYEESFSQALEEAYQSAERAEGRIEEIAGARVREQMLKEAAEQSAAAGQNAVAGQNTAAEQSAAAGQSKAPGGPRTADGSVTGDEIGQVQIQIEKIQITTP